MKALPLALLLAGCSAPAPITEARMRQTIDDALERAKAQPTCPARMLTTPVYSAPAMPDGGAFSSTPLYAAPPFLGAFTTTPVYSSAFPERSCP